MALEDPFSAQREAKELLAVHLKQAPLSLVCIAACVALSLLFGLPSVGLVVLSLLAGLGIAACWRSALLHKPYAATAWACAALMLSGAGLALDGDRNFQLQIVQGIGLTAVSVLLVALTSRVWCSR